MDWIPAPSHRPLARAAVYGLGSGLAAVVLIGVPTDVIPNPFFTRMIPTRPQDYLFLVITAILVAVLGATYAFPASCTLQEGKLAGGGFFSYLAVGCPVCNKIVVLLLGASGALDYFAPVQPVLALTSIVMLGFAVVLRLRAVRTGFASTR